VLVTRNETSTSNAATRLPWRARISEERAAIDGLQRDVSGAHSSVGTVGRTATLLFANSAETDVPSAAGLVRGAHAPSGYARHSRAATRIVRALTGAIDANLISRTALIVFAYATILVGIAPEVELAAGVLRATGPTGIVAGRGQKIYRFAGKEGVRPKLANLTSGALVVTASPLARSKEPITCFPWGALEVALAGVEMAVTRVHEAACNRNGDQDIQRVHDTGPRKQESLPFNSCRLET
jgi:hypothetical protein